MAKGVSFRAAVLKHALRNSLIPIATHFGQNLILLVTGQFLVEFIFDMGLLGLSSVFDRDYPTVMGVLVVSSTVLLLGNIISDILVAMIDPRIRFR
jgi:microcin C transport system permease protein